MKTKKLNWESIKKVLLSKEFIMCLVMCFLVIAPTFAETGGIEELDTWGQKILDLFTSIWVKAIIMIALIVKGIMTAVQYQQGGGAECLKKFIPWIVGCVILLTASSIVGYFTDGMSFEVKN